MPVNTLLTGSVVKVKEDVIDKIFNYSPDDAPLLSMIGSESVGNVYKEWQRDSYRTPDPTRAAIEGADASYAAQVEPTLLNNRTQIFQDTVSVSNTAQAVDKYGRKDEAARLCTKKMVELKRDMEAAFISNSATVTGTSSVAAKARGLYGFITNGSFGVNGVAPNPVTNTAPVDGTDRALDEAMFKTGLASAFTNGGKGSVALVSPAHKQKISTFTGNVQRTNEVGSKQAATLNAAYDFYRSDFGVTKVIPNRVQAVSAKGLNDTVYIIDPEILARGDLRSFEREKLATVGDAVNWQVRCESTLIAKDEKPLYMITDLTVTGS